MTLKKGILVTAVFLIGICILTYYLLPVRKQTFSKLSYWQGGPKLRGVNIWQKRINPTEDGDGLGVGKLGPPYSIEGFAELASLGANLVVISHPGLFNEAPPYALNLEVEKNLDGLLDLIERAGLFAVIAFRTGPGRNENGFNAEDKTRALHSVWSSSLEQNAWGKMWQYTALRYAKRKSVVGFELMVEPNADAVAPQFKNPELVWNPFLKSLVNAVRAVDEETPILVSPLGYSSPDWISKLEIPADGKTVLSVHQYSPYEYTHQLPQQKIALPTDANPTLKMQSIYPIAVTEFGSVRWAPSASKYLENQMAAFEAKGFNYAVWLWESPLPSITYDEFNYRKGLDSENKKDLREENALLETFKKFWKKNRLKFK